MRKNWQTFLLIALLTPFLGTSVLAGQGFQETTNSSRTPRLEEIVVTGTKTPHTLKDVPVETSLITNEDIERSNAQTAMDVVNDIPGIQAGMHSDVFGSYTWRTRMRGMSINDGYALVLVDGQRVMGCGQSGGMGEYGIGLNQIPVNMIEKIEVIKGPGSALYGSDAVAGVINIITKDPPKNSRVEAGAQHGWYDVRTKNGNDLYTGKSSQTYFSFGDTYADRFGTLLHYSHETSEGVDTEKADQSRNYGLGKLHTDFSRFVHLDLKGELSHYEEQSEKDPEKKDEDSYRLSGKLSITPTKDHRVLLSGSTYNWDFVSGWPGYPWGYKHGDIGYHQGELQYTAHLADWNILTVGGEFRRQAIDYTIENPGGTVIPVKEDVDAASVYLQNEVALFKDLTLVPGFRYEDHSTFDDQVNPKLSIMYDVSSKTTVRASTGRLYKSPTIRQLYYQVPYKHHGYYMKSDPELDPEKGWGYSLNIEKRIMEGKMVFNLGVYRNDIKDKVVRKNSGTYKGETLKIYKNVQDAYVQGLEFQTRTRLTKRTSCNLSYTYTDSKNKDVDKELPYTPKHTASFSPSYTFINFDTGINTQISYIGKQYDDLANEKEIDSTINVDAEVYKDLSSNTRISFEADNIFNGDKAVSDPDDEMVGRSYTIKIKGSF